MNAFKPEINNSSQENENKSLNIFDCPNYDEKQKSKMKSEKSLSNNKTVYDIGLLFFKIDDYKIMKFLVVKLDDENEFIEPKIASMVPNMDSRIIYAATGKKYF
jgi:hypothetical protein